VPVFAGKPALIKQNATRCFLSTLGCHQLIPQLSGFAQQSPELSVLAPGFKFFKASFNIGFLFGQ